MYVAASQEFSGEQIEKVKKYCCKGCPCEFLKRNLLYHHLEINPEHKKQITSTRKKIKNASAECGDNHSPSSVTHFASSAFLNSPHPSMLPLPDFESDIEEEE
jgi:hypothetical protein